MHVENLIKMANQIGAFFEAMPDHEQAVADIVRHLKNSWDPRMRASLLQHVAAEVDAELKPIVREALALLRKG
ncbi:MAG: formate dehydrogenase subunit delta [Rugosibacter sp.]|nr:formate dehydrogenase subunit delta [Rugosibacter sp.]